MFSIWMIAKPPTAYRKPPLLTRFTELLSWGNSVKGSHLRRFTTTTLGDTAKHQVDAVVLVFQCSQILEGQPESIKCFLANSEND